MKDKMMKLSHKLEVRKAKAEKKGAASLEQIIVSGLLIALAAGLIVAFSGTLSNSADSSNDAVGDAVTTGLEDAKANLNDKSGTETPKYNAQ